MTVMFACPGPTALIQPEASTRGVATAVLLVRHVTLVLFGVRVVPSAFLSVTAISVESLLLAIVGGADVI